MKLNVGRWPIRRRGRVLHNRVLDSEGEYREVAQSGPTVADRMIRTRSRKRALGLEEDPLPSTDVGDSQLAFPDLAVAA